jgi:hypothetical protein
MKKKVGCLISVGFLLVFIFLIIYQDNRRNSNKEKELYQIAINENTHVACLDYMRKYPQGKYYDEIYQKDDEKCWEVAVSDPTSFIYDWYVSLHPDGKYKEAIAKLEQGEEKKWENESDAWNLALKNYDWEKYLSLYPNGVHAKEAEKRIVDGIMSNGNYSKLPPMQKISNGYNNEPTTQISISNNTSYKLTIYYSGVDSKRVILLPHQSSTVELTNGEYRIAAVVDASNVSKYAGYESLSGGNYSSTYYIETRRH